MFMGTRITFSLELVSSKCVAFNRQFCSHAINLCEVSAGYFPGATSRHLIYQHDFGAKSLHHLCALRRVAFGHDSNEWVAFDTADDGKAGAHIATCQLNDCLPML